MEIQLARQRTIRPTQVLDLYARVGWWPERTPSDVSAAVAAGEAAGAWEGEQLVGFARLVTDGCVRAYVEDLIVDPAHQRERVGTALVQRLLGAANVDVVSVFCDERLSALYERLGFVATDQMVLHLHTQARALRETNDQAP